MDSKNTVTSERQTFYCVPIPGENPWVKEISFLSVMIYSTQLFILVVLICLLSINNVYDVDESTVIVRLSIYTVFLTLVTQLCLF